MRSHELLVGTSGFDYAHWDRRFYPKGLARTKRLVFYAERFRTVELNVTFYRTPSARTFEQWRDAVPDGFCFAVKASRYLTHIRRLVDPRDPVEYLMERINRLGDRLGPVLVQLPPDMPIALDRLDDTLDAFGAGIQVAVEPRHGSWFVPELADLLRRRRAALCLADRKGPITPLWRTAPWLYLRFHDGRASPRSCYGDRALNTWVERVSALWPRPSGYIYFNNDAHACAIRNGDRFASLLEARFGSRHAQPHRAA
jgi:uncharacterized protein YecE (DUF72 family)